MSIVYDEDSAPSITYDVQSPEQTKPSLLSSIDKGMSIFPGYNLAKGVLAAYGAVRKPLVSFVKKTAPIPMALSAMGDADIPFDLPKMSVLMPEIKGTTSGNKMADIVAGGGVDTLAGTLAGESIPAAYKGARGVIDMARSSEPNMLNTLFKSGRSFTRNIEAGAVSAMDKSSDLNQMISSELPAIKGENSAIYGQKEKLIPHTTRGALVNDILHPVMDVSPSMKMTPAYEKLQELVTRHGLTDAADIGASMTDELGMPLAGPNGIPKLKTDVIPGAAINNMKQELYLAAQHDPSGRSMALYNDFTRALEKQAPDTFKGIQSLNREAAPTIDAARQAEMFGGNYREGAAGTKYISKLAENHLLGKASPEEKEFLDVLANGNGDFKGLGPDVKTKFQGVIDEYGRMSKLKKLKTQQAVLRVLGVPTVVGGGLFRARAILAALGIN